MINELLAFENIILENADKYSLDPLLISAIIMQESRGRVWSARFEPSLKFSYMPQSYAKKCFISLETEVVFQRTSWSLMQVLGVKARELGFDGFLPQLLLPSLAIEYGCKVLGDLTKKYQKLNDVIVSYNSGSPRYLASGKYINEDYLSGVKSWLIKVK